MIGYKKTILQKISYNPFSMNSFDKEEKALAKAYDDGKTDQRGADQIALEKVEDAKQEVINALIDHIDRLNAQVRSRGEEPVK